MMLGCLAVSLSGLAQSAAPTPSGQVPQPAQKIPTVTTTVVVHAEIKNTYIPESVDFGSLDGAFVTAQETPLSMSVATRALLNDQGARVLSDVVKNDASIGEDYAPVGYYGDYEIRGFPIDLATGLEINGMTIAGEQDVPFENKQSIEFVKGIAGVESGVATAGGLINFVTKPVLKVQAADVATDHRGTSYGAIDLGRLFQSAKSSGLRINLAGEDMHTYVESANGWRAVGAADGAWQLDPATTLLADFDYQHKVQRSESGYQLLGGTEVPTRAYPSLMLGYQSWGKPNTFDVFNAGSRLLHTFNSHWSARLAGSYSHSLIDDNVIWPYGAALDANRNSLCPDSLDYFFCPDGSYEIYDYRSPGELRIDALGEVLLQGHFKTGAVAHDFVAGGSLFHRSVDLSPATVDEPLGVENVYQPNVAYAQESPYKIAPPSTLADFNHQSAGLIQDRFHLPGGVMLQAGGRYVRVSDFNYTSPRSLWLPQYAATYTPQLGAGGLHPLTFYGNYAVLLSLGPQASWWVDNSSLFLDPFFTRQSEVGVKYEHGILLTADVFRMRQPFFYPKAIQAPDSFCNSSQFVAPGDLCFEAQGHETHSGIELNAQGKAASWMQLSGSATVLRAISTETGTPAFDHKQVLNVPHVHTTFFADVALPRARGLHLMPGWSYTGRKAATRDGQVSVASYNLFNLGARYMPGGEQGRVTLRLFADNILDKRYWKDTGASYGDTFIHQGAPTTVRLSAHYTF